MNPSHPLNLHLLGSLRSTPQRYYHLYTVANEASLKAKAKARVIRVEGGRDDNDDKVTTANLKTVVIASLSSSSGKTRGELREGQGMRRGERGEDEDKCEGRARQVNEGKRHIPQRMNGMLKDRRKHVTALQHT
ncbi:hypothetical protein OG21DRAFT_1526906 [Imleria badia]|nr:hypothetical protein OG21DRAFT_1526906 [Imleria badia]